MCPVYRGRKCAFLLQRFPEPLYTAAQRKSGKSIYHLVNKDAASVAGPSGLECPVECYLSCAHLESPAVCHVSTRKGMFYAHLE